MRKLVTLIFAVIVLGTSMYAFADDISPLDLFNNTNNTTDINNTINSTNNTTNSSLLNNTQLEQLNSIQSRISALIVSIDSLTTTYQNNSKAKGLLNALAQYKKQAIKLNDKIEDFKANPQVYAESKNSTVNGLINSFNSQVNALEKKVSVKAGLLSKIKVKTKKVTPKNNNKKVNTKTNTKKVNNKKPKK